MNAPPIVVGLGEVLWDVLPSGRQLGGAPANFAYCAHLLGNRAVIASRVGDDDLGRELKSALTARGLNVERLQVDSTQPTGTVQVQVDSEGQPDFKITQPSAWDFMQFSDNWKMLAEQAGAVCFGSLAQRSPASREAILKFLDSTRPEALRVFDLNLRQSFYSYEIIRSSLLRAHVLKLNDSELPVLASMLRLDATDLISFCRRVLQEFDLRLVCVTRGSRGSVLVNQGDEYEHAGFRVSVKDTVGAGDAFTAGLVHDLLRGPASTLAAISDTANRMGAWAASQAGGMPPIPEWGLHSSLSRLTPA